MEGEGDCGRRWWSVGHGDSGSGVMGEIRNGKTARVNDGTRHRPPGTNIKS